MSKRRRDRAAERPAPPRPARTGTVAAGRPRAAAANVAWGAVADAVGHCMVVFAFVPVLAAVPGWLWAEATNGLNREDPIVLAFLPVRAAVLLLNTFVTGALPGVVAGVIDGALVSAWVASRGRPADRRSELAIGAACGAVAAVLMVIAAAAYETSQGRPAPLRPGAIAFELASGTVCGLLAMSTALRLLAPHRATSASASHQ